MSVLGILSSSLFGYNTQSVQNKAQQFRQEFQKLGQDLQSGNLSAAQADFATLQQAGPQSNSTTSSTSSAQSSNPIAQAFNQLATDLKAGNVSAAQKDYATIQQDMQNQGAQGHHHHHHHGGGEGGSGTSAVSQVMNQLGQALQSGNLTSAQQAYSVLQLNLQQYAQNNGLQPTTQSGSNSVSVNA